MKSLFVIVAVLIGFSQQQSFAQGRNDDFNSLLWEISSDSSKTSYLFGTMHLMREDDFFFPDTLETLVRSSDLLVMELNGEIFEPSIIDLMILEEGEFFDFFSEEQLDSIYVFAEENLSMPKDLFRTSFAKMKPFIVSQVFAMFQMNENDTVTADTRSHEMEFNEISLNNNIEVAGLETAKEQITLFDDLPKAVQTEMVMEQVRGTRTITGFNEISELYLKQNIDSLYHFIHDGDSYLADFENTFLTARNKNWIPKIEAQMKEKHVFIAVGAGHLGGPDGLVRLLIKEGYRVKPVKL